MRDFTLFLDVGGDWIPISSPTTGNTSMLFSSYDEQLQEQRHSQYTLTFSIPKHVEHQDLNSKLFYKHSNPLLPYFCMGAKLYLILDQYKQINFIISSIKPTTGSHNASLAITAQDEVSYLWSKHNLNYSYKTVQSNNTELLTTKNIYEITEDILADNYLDNAWQLSSCVSDPQLKTKRFTLDISNSNPYNVLIEACNVIGADLVVNYNTHRLDFIAYADKTFSGYQYRPETNLQSYDSSYEGAELTTILHVTGGTDADGQTITMVPPMPLLLKNYIGEYLKDPSLDQEIVFPTWSEIEQEVAAKIDSYVPSYAFVPIVKCVLNSNRKNLLLQGTYITRFDDAAGVYFGEITVPETNNSDLINVYSFPIDPSADLPFNVEGVPDAWTGQYQEYNIDLIHYQNGQLVSDRVPAVISHSIQDLNQYCIDTRYKMRQEARSFFSIVAHNDYLGQSLIDFSPFRALMSADDWNYLYSMIHNTWRNLNIQSNYYTNEYYTNSSMLYQTRQTFLRYAENYASTCSALEQELQSTHNEVSINNYLSQIRQARETLHRVVMHSNYFDIIDTIGHDEALDLLTTDEENIYTYYWDKMIREYKERIVLYQDKLSELYHNATLTDYSIAIEGEIRYYEELVKTTQTLCTHFNIHTASEFFPGVCELIKECIIAHTPVTNANHDSALASKFYGIQKQIAQTVFKPLYQNYGQFIYEQNYSNTEELDSVGLYNQAIIQLNNLNRVKESHSLVVLDIGSLQCVSVPRLTLGSVIQVYNKDSLQAMPYNSFIAELDKTSALYEYACRTKNATLQEKYKILRDDIYVKLQNHYKMLTGEELSGEQILNKLCFDEIQVTGITRVLREPLKDSVTVEQPSRYQSILAKLIKSI